ncbi:diguanylate cyclase [Vibrio sp. HN007]|uniref:diguanylate cyclase n=1 Tax=Vibrio iocasae TaxID=3098914 RepID=UPI0035D50672
MIRFLPECAYEENYILFTKKKSLEKGSLWEYTWTDRIEVFQKSAAYRNELKLLETTSGKGIPDVVGYNSDNNLLELSSKADEWLINLDIKELTFDERLRVTISMLRALEALHSKNILHLALRPSSFLVSNDLTYAEIVDLTSAQRYARETSEIAAFQPTCIDEHFIAPEQAYIHGQSMDVRTDIYSFGAVLYWLFCESLPFADRGKYNLLYAQIAEPIDLAVKLGHSAQSDAFFSVLKSLLEKGMDNRYQSAAGLLAELTLVRDSLAIEESGNRTLTEQLIFPSKLYGREPELEKLMGAFTRVSKGPSEALLIGGYSGVGKSALVHEIRKPVLMSDGLFVSGKFDQYQRHTPYFAIAEALDKFIRHLLSLPKPEMESWSDRITKVLYPNAQALIELLPQLGKLIGAQPALPMVGPEEQENRFNRVFLEFVREVCTSHCPLVFFIDDLQWADNASINLLNLLISDAESRHCLILGAYRDNEVDERHPFSQMYQSLEKEEARVTKINLQPLKEESVTEILADTLRLQTEDVVDLSTLVYSKTSGNPFFLRQFIRELNNQNLLRFDIGSSRWQWSFESIQGHSITDNVVELMEAKLQQLPFATVELVKMAACIGSKIALNDLAELGKADKAKLSEILQPAFDTGMLYPTIEKSSLNHAEIRDVTFVHDRIQQAAYSMLDEKQKKDIHYRYGTILLSRTAELEQNTFDILAHLNQTHSLLNKHQAELLVELSQQAVQKTKASNAYSSSVQYLESLSKLLELSETQNEEINNWVALEKTECLYLSGNYEKAEECKANLANARLSLNEQIRLKSILITQYTRYGELKRAIDEGLEALLILGLPLSGSMEDIGKEIASIQDALSRSPFPKLVDQADVTDPKILLQLDILMTMQPCCYNSGSSLFPMTILKLLGITIKNGNSPYSSYIFMMYALLCTKVLKDYQTASEAASCSEVVAKKYPANPLLEGRLLMMRSNFVMPWLSSLPQSADTRVRAYQMCFSQGDYYWGVHAYIFGFYAELFSSSSIDDLLTRTQKVKDVCKQIKQPAQVYLSTLQCNTLNILKGSLDNHGNLEHRPGYEKEALAHYEETHYMCGKYDRLLGRLLQGYLFGNHTTALKIALNPELGSDSLDEGIFHEAAFTLLNLLNILELKRTEPTVIEEYHEQWFEQAWGKYQKWHDLNAENFSAGFHLLQAEMQALVGEELSALSHYEQAINHAKEAGIALLLALSNERCGKYRKTLGHDAISKAYIEQAMSVYSAWGAHAKSSQLEHELSDFDDKAVAGLSGEGVNWRSVIRSSQGMSQAITIDKLTRDMLFSSAKTTGAKMVSMFTWEHEGWSTRLCYDKGEFVEERDDKKTVDNIDIPETMLNYCYNSQNALVLNDAINRGDYILDPYVVNRHVRSALVLPIVVHNQTVAVIMLEHDETKNLFTHQRQSMMELLGSQFAITYQNVLNYQKLENQKEELEEAVELRTHELNEKNLYLETIMQTLPIPYAVTTPEGILLQGNAHLYECLETTFEDMSASTAYDHYVHEHDRDEMLKALRETGYVVDYECQLKSSQGRKFWAQLSVSKMNVNGQLALFTTIKDVSDKKDKELLLQKQAETDPLTGAFNRRAFERLAADKKLSSVENNYVALLDIDHFKVINDTYGHAAGDEALKVFCMKVQSRLRNGDLLGRIGGEEFGIVLSNDSSTTVVGIMERLRHVVEEMRIQHEENEFRFTMSIGLTQWQPKEDLEQAMCRADKCLYDAKAGGRNLLVSDLARNS